MAVPCCHHELLGMGAGELEGIVGRGALRERFASVFTDGLRAALLECHGYRCQVMEFIEMEHTAKNMLIRAIRREKDQKREAADNQGMERIASLMNRYGASQTLYRLLTE